MNKKAWIYSIITYILICVLLIYLFNKFWPDKEVLSTIIPLVVAGLITHFIRKLYDFIYDLYNRKTEDTFLGVSLNVDNSSRKIIGYGSSNGEVVHAGNFKADYQVEAEIIVTIQNESPNTIYGVEVSFTPNDYSKQFSLIDPRQNKLQPLEANKHFEFTLRISHLYYDVHYQDADRDLKKLYKIGKETSLLNGSKIIIKYKDTKHKEHTKIQVIE